MTSKDKQPGGAAPSASEERDLRRRAEEKLSSGAADAQEFPSLEEATLLLHELRVHQIELEMQNEELRRIQTELEGSRSKYFDLYDLAPVGYLTLNDKGVILEANLAAARQLGTERSQARGRRLTGFLDKESQDLFFLDLRQLFQSGQPQSFVLRVTSQDGSGAWLHIETVLRQEGGGDPLCWVILTDISVQMQIDQALRRKSDELDQFFQLSLDLFCIADTDGTFLKLNSQWATTLGYPLAELEGHSFLELVHPDDQQATEGVISQLRAQLEAPVFVNRYRCRDGSIRWLEWHAITSGKTIFATARDITERKRLAEAISQARTDLLFSVSHELKTPLMTMLHVQELLDGMSPEEERIRFNEYGEVWSRNLMRLHRMINNLVDSQRTEDSRFPLQLAISQPAGIVTRVCQETAPYAQALQVSLHLKLEPVPQGSSDEEALARVVENLLTNAIKFSPKGGHVEVHLWMEEDALLLEVEDHGSGISAEEQVNLFQPFQRGRSAERKGIPGTGLGLYVSRRIVEEHGGALTLISEEGKGTKVTVRLPWGKPE